MLRFDKFNYEKATRDGQGHRRCGCLFQCGGCERTNICQARCHSCFTEASQPGSQGGCRRPRKVLMQEVDSICDLLC